MGLPAPGTQFAHQQHEALLVARVSATGLPGFRILLQLPCVRHCTSGSSASGVPEVDQQAVRTVRLEQGRPRYGEDITDQRLPHETQLLHAGHFNKGCYLGQEIVERVRTRGQVHRLLVRLAIEGQGALPAGVRIMSGGQEIGEITSAAWSPALGRIVALGYVRREELESAGALEAAGHKVSVLSQPPA
jgi:folate-binding protein YgfZ